MIEGKNPTICQVIENLYHSCLQANDEPSINYINYRDRHWAKQFVDGPYSTAAIITNYMHSSIDLLLVLIINCNGQTSMKLPWIGC